MWYREAVTRIDPSGQLNIDYGDDYKKRFDPRKVIDFNYVGSGIETPHIINAYLKGTEQLLGSIEFLPHSRIVDVMSISVQQYTTDQMQKYLQALKDSGYIVDESSVSRKGWGIGELLYREMKSYISKNFPYIVEIAGEVHSKEAFKARNKVFGMPSEVYGWLDEFIIPTMSKKQKQEMIPTIEKEFPGTESNEYGDYNILGEGITVRHRLPRLSIRNKISSTIKSASELEQVLDWLDRHDVEKENGKYVFYHGTRIDLPYLKANSLLATNTEDATEFGDRNYINDRRKSLKVYKILVDPEDIYTGHWASLKRNMPVELVYKISIKR